MEDHLKKLTPKERAFVVEYPIDLNASKAAERAGYSPRNARKIGWQLLQKQKIKIAIGKQVKLMLERAELRSWMVLKETAQIAFANIKDILEFGGGQDYRLNLNG